MPITYRELIKAMLPTLLDDLRRAFRWMCGTGWTLFGDCIAFAVIVALGAMCVFLLFGGIDTMMANGGLR